MTEREILRVQGLKLSLVNHAGGRCEVCGAYMTAPQLAHKIPQTKRYLKKYGAAVIHHPHNLAVVCSLKCNVAVLCDPSTRPVKAAALVKWIKETMILGDGDDSR